MDINNIISKMTIEQKIKLITGKSSSNTNEIEEFEIPSLYLADGANGVRIWDSGETTICYPTSSALSSSWNVDLAKQLGEYLGDECIEKKVDVLLSPGINIKRTPLCGRNFEYYSEDVCLTTEIASAFVEGVQSTGVGACVKHFAGYNSENGSIFGTNTEIDERTMREIYLKTFENIIKKSNPYSIMCSYNRLNGVFASENKYLLTEVLRNEWKYDGLVVSDWGSVHNRINSLKAGLDLEMPNPAEDRVKELTDAVNSGKLKEEDIDKSVLKMLALISKLKGDKTVKYNTEDRLKLAEKIAEESITLLKNEQEILPLNCNVKQKILIVGDLARKPVYQGGGCAYVNNDNPKTPYEEIEKIAGNNLELEYAVGFENATTLLDGEKLYDAVEKSKKADKIIFFIGNPYNTERETFDRSDMTFGNNMLQVLDYVLRNNKNVILVIQAGSAVDMRLFKNRAKAIIMQWYSGECGATALANILLGKINPSGKLSETFPVRLSDTPSHNTLTEYENVIDYKEGLFIGYSHYERNNIKPQFEFGFGLSYTRFEYSNLKIAANGNQYKVSFDIQNVGDREGKEVCQLYIAPTEFRTARQDKLLKRFEKVHLKANETKTVHFELTKEDIEVYNISIHNWHSYSGDYKILIGSSCLDMARLVLIMQTAV